MQVGHHGLKTLAFFRKLLGEKESTLVEITAAEKKGFSGKSQVGPNKRRHRWRDLGQRRVDSNKPVN